MFSCLFRTHDIHLLGPFYSQKWQISLRFSILHVVKSLPFHITEAWKSYPFWVQPSCIGHYMEYPQLPTPHPPLPHANNKTWKEIIVNLMLQAFLEHLEVKIIIINAIPGILWKGIVIYLFICDNMTSLKLRVWTVWCKCWTWQRWLFFLKLKSNYSWWNAAKINNITCIITTVSLMKWTAENF